MFCGDLIGKEIEREDICSTGSLGCTTEITQHWKAKITKINKNLKY